MQLLPVWAIMAAAVAPRSVAPVHVSCDCHLWDKRQTSIALHCARGEGGPSRSYCNSASVADIPRGYHYVPGYALIKLYRTLKPWAAAKKTCEDEGSLLATPRDHQAFAGLRDILNNKVRGVRWGYIGFTDQQKEGAFVGVDGRPVSYIPWKGGQPDNNQNNENCLDFNSTGETNDVNCDNAAPFFCERRLSVPIIHGYTWVGDAGRFYKVHSELYIYATAAEVCRAENGRLAVTDTWARGEGLLSTFDLDIDSFQLYFIGFTDEAVEGDFVTDTGRHLSDMEFQVWGINEPNNSDGGRPENCLALARRGFYSDVRCDRQLPFICEILPL